MRDRRLQRAVDTISLHGGLMGAAEVAEALNVQVPNLSWQPVEPFTRISRGRIPVYLAADVQAEINARAAKGQVMAEISTMGNIEHSEDDYMPISERWPDGVVPMGEYENVLERARLAEGVADSLHEQLRGAVEALRPYLRHAVANCTPLGTDTEDRCICGLTDVLRRFGGQ